jgi:hypothetical protein
MTKFAILLGSVATVAASLCRGALNGITLKARRHSAVPTTTTSLFGIFGSSQLYGLFAATCGLGLVDSIWALTF